MEDAGPPFVSMQLFLRWSIDRETRRHDLHGLLTDFAATEPDHAPGELPLAVVEPFLHATVVAADFVGIADIEFRWRDPDGVRRQIRTDRLVFEGKPPRLAEYVEWLRIETRKLGEHWIEVLINGALKSAAPFSVTYTHPNPSTGSAPS